MKLDGVPIVVTGGAGYIGATVAHELARQGARVTVVDDLSNGHRVAVGELPFIEADVRDQAALERVLRESGARAVCHLAGLANLPASFADPAKCHAINVGGVASLLGAMERVGVGALVFASTCAIYAPPSAVAAALREGDPEAPASPYAASKQLAERAIAVAAEGPVRALALRFFNAAGADRRAGIGESHDPESHAIPLLVRFALHRGDFAIFGDDYPTRDGTCVRDYVHVVDLARAHAAAVALLLDGHPDARGVVNLGSGVGTTVADLVARTTAQLGVTRRPAVAARRQGDTPVLLADPTRARALLGWTAEHDLDAILADAIWWERQRGASPK